VVHSDDYPGQESGFDAMSKTFRLSTSQLRVGQPLGFNTFDSDGNLLLAKGYVIQSREQLEQLVERGLYSESHIGPSFGPGGAAAAPVPGAIASVPKRQRFIFDDIVALRDRLDSVLSAPNPADFPAAITDIAGTLIDGIDLDSDAAVATLLISRQGRPAAREALNVATLTALLMPHLDNSEETRRAAICAALTMNITAMALTDALYHQPTPADEEQRRQMFRHPREGEARLRELGVTDATWLRAVVEHHEGIDGSGYPAKLVGEAISLPAQVIFVADRYCGMVTERAARPGMLPDAAMQQILLRKGKMIDTRIAAQLLKEIGIYPPGTAVKLASEECGIVMKRSLNPSQPVVWVVRDNRGKSLPAPFKRLTNKPSHAVAQVIQTTDLGDDLKPQKVWAPLWMEDHGDSEAVVD
jgi:HD-GYP domain-containing protein (c-di-GMP phosphodiesterase class II)